MGNRKAHDIGLEAATKRSWVVVISAILIPLAILGYFLNQRIIRIEGQWIAYYCAILTGDGGGFHTNDSAILLTDVNHPGSTRQLIRVSNPGRVHSPAWLSNNVIAFELNYDIRVMQLNSFSSYILNPESTAIYSFPAWSPDGNRIAFVRHLSALYLYDVASSEEVELMQLDNPAPPSWSPDGQSIVIGQNNAILIVDVAEKTTSVLLEVEKGGNIRAAWSPDGSTIVFDGLINDVYGLYRVDIDSGDTHLISDIVGSSPAWSPDGEWIAFVVMGSGQGIYKIRPDGTDLQEIYTDNRCSSAGAPAWSQAIES